MRRGFDQALRAAPRTVTHLSLLPSPTIDQSDQRWFPLPRLRGEQIAVGVGSQRDNAKSFPLPGQDLQCRSADRPGRAEDCHPNAHITPNMRYSPAAAGMTKYSESSRSSTPPWPGIRFDESLRPASRLNSDSAM